MLECLRVVEETIEKRITKGIVLGNDHVFDTLIQLETVLSFLLEHCPPLVYFINHNNEKVKINLF